MTDFAAGESIDLIGFGFADGAAAAAAFTQQGSDVVFSSGGVTATFQNAQLADVTAGILLDGVVPQETGGTIAADSFNFSGLVAAQAAPDVDGFLLDAHLAGAMDFSADQMVFNPAGATEIDPIDTTELAALVFEDVDALLA